MARCPQIQAVETPHGVYFRLKSATTTTLRDYLASLVYRPGVKSATLGGEQEQGFEQAFGALAYTYLKDKAPRLIDFMVGFQLVERNDDNTKAMAVFGFKVGDQWLYVPVFFLNGDLKGHELLYIKNKDTFVPLKENWVNYLIARKPHILGEPSGENAQQLGGLLPDLSRLLYPPGGTKYSADRRGALPAQRPSYARWLHGFLPALGAVATKAPAFLAKTAQAAEQLDLRRTLQDFGLLKQAFDLACAYPLIKQGFDRFYGADFFTCMGQDCRRRAGSFVLPPSPAPPPRRLSAPSGRSFLPAPAPVPVKTAVEIYVDDEASITRNREELTEAEREKLLRDTVLIKDKRDPHATSVVYNTQIELRLTNPGESGLYEVLERPGSFDRMLVLMHPQGGRRKHTAALLVRLSDPRAWLLTHPTNLWTRNLESELDLRKWYDNLTSATLSEGGTYVAVGPRGESSVPFEVIESRGDDVYEVRMREHVSYGKERLRSLPPLAPPEDYTFDDNYTSWSVVLRVVDRPGSAIRAVPGELRVPKDYKILKLDDPPKPRKEDGESFFGCGCGGPSLDGGGDGSAKRPIEPGNLADVQTLIYEKTAALKLYVPEHGDETWVITPQRGHERMSKKAALLCLVRDHGCTEDAARSMLTEATRAGVGRRAVSYRIKYAQNSSVLQPGPTAPNFPEPWAGSEMAGLNSVQAIYPQEHVMPVPGLESSRTDPRIYDPLYMPDPYAAQVAQRASQSGQKEIFDTAVLSTLLKTVRQDSIVDRHLGALMTALDKLGRIFFLFCWHQEEFEERYGKQDMPELEDSLRNAFEVLGDVVLFLKEKSVGRGENLPGVGGDAIAEPSVQEAARG